MTTNQQEYIDYLTRQIRAGSMTIQDANKLAMNRLVGKSYGLSENEMDEVGKLWNQ